MGVAGGKLPSLYLDTYTNLDFIKALTFYTALIDTFLYDLCHPFLNSSQQSNRIISTRAGKNLGEKWAWQFHAPCLPFSPSPQLTIDMD